MPEGPLKVSDVHKEGCTLKWNPPLDDGGSPIDHYFVEKLDTDTGKWVPAGRSKDPTISLDNLEPNHEYQFRVAAVNSEGESEPLVGLDKIVAKNAFDPPDPPGTPEAVDWDKDFVDLKWTKPANDNGSPITGYVIEKRDEMTGKWVKAADIKGTEPKGRVNNLDEGETYEFRVRAINEAGPSDPSKNSKPVTCKPRKRKYGMRGSFIIRFRVHDIVYFYAFINILGFTRFTIYHFFPVQWLPRLIAKICVP